MFVPAGYRCTGVAAVGELKREHRPPSLEDAAIPRPTMRLGRNRCQGTESRLRPDPTKGEGMSYESERGADQARVPVRLPVAGRDIPQERRDDLVQPFELVFDEGLSRA